MTLRLTLYHVGSPRFGVKLLMRYVGGYAADTGRNPPTLTREIVCSPTRDIETEKKIMLDILREDVIKLRFDYACDVPYIDGLGTCRTETVELDLPARTRVVSYAFVEQFGAID